MQGNVEKDQPKLLLGFPILEVELNPLVPFASGQKGTGNEFSV
jgi:hypothetical protein